ncbi:hypothetical protein [Hoeflea sp.]|uniref:hypothetical protein n=1 Tax=Hoeflea sp. TaxID=1940281 RepID=UPI003748CC3E
MIGYFLIALSFLAAAVGTLSQTTRTIKIAIMCIAGLTAGASAWVYYEDEQEKTLNKRLIVSLVQATQDESAFSEELRIAANDIMDDRTWYVSSLTFSNSGLHLTANNSTDDEFAGAIFLDNRKLRDIRYALAAQTGLAEELQLHLLTDLWTADTIESDWNRIAPIIGELAASALEDFAPEAVQTAMGFPDGNSVRIVAKRDIQQSPYVVVLNRDHIQALVEVEPLERGRIISGIVVEQMVDQL